MDQYFYKKTNEDSKSLGITRAVFVLSFSLLVLTVTTLILPAEATSDETNADQDYQWSVLTGNDLLNDPTAIKILQNIEISKQRIAELKNPQVVMTEHQKFIEEQRMISQAKLQEQLDRMNKNHEDFLPRAAFAKFVAKQPAYLHDFYWSLFDYMEQKVINAREARDAILENGGSYYDAQQTFISLAQMPKAERIQYFNEMVIKYGQTNIISDMDDFKALPIKTQNAFYAYSEKNNLGAAKLYNLEEQAPSSDTTEAVQLVSFSSPIILGDTQDEIPPATTDVDPILTSSETAMDFDGYKYKTKVVGSMDNISEFTLSTWIKPDYSQGSSELTILSKENAFSLTINNNKLSQQIARFSVFDGIKWTMVESVSPIQEEWTHIAATLDGSSISIYINGNLEATKQIAGIPYMNSYGFVDTKPIENISSDSEILIGAQQTTKRGALKSMGFFAGSVDEVVIENKLLEDQQIIELCQQSQYYSA